jgi:hypothetical protein
VSPYNQDFVSALVYRGTIPAEELVQAELGKMGMVEAQAGEYAEQHAELLEKVSERVGERGVVRECGRGSMCPMVQAELGKMGMVEAQAGEYAEQHTELLEKVRGGD